VTADFIHDILREPSYNIRILSLRDAKHLNERLLCQALKTACRRGRPSGTPSIKALYILTHREQQGDQPRQDSCTVDISPEVISHQTLRSDGDGDAWYARRGAMITRPTGEDWAQTLRDCEGAIAFDAVLCRAPRHHNSPVFGRLALPRPSTAGPNSPPFAVATHAVGGCAGCGGAPEGWTTWGDGDGAGAGAFPLLAPPPLHSSNVRAAQCPGGQSLTPGRFAAGKTEEEAAAAARFIARCTDCLRERYCRGCHQWWCEACYTPAPRMAPGELTGDERKVRLGLNGRCDACTDSEQAESLPA
jgi:hypothetical protein